MFIAFIEVYIYYNNNFMNLINNLFIHSKIYLRLVNIKIFLVKFNIKKLIWKYNWLEIGVRYYVKNVKKYYIFLINRIFK